MKTQLKKFFAFVMVFSCSLVQAQIINHSRFRNFGGDSKRQSAERVSSYTGKSFMGTSTANAPAIQWQKCIGGSRDENV